MLELLIIGFIFWLGYQAGCSVTSYRLRHIIFKEAKRLGITSKADEELFQPLVDDKPIVAQLIVEKSNNVLYLYNKKDNTFVCQATTLSELAKLAKQYKNIKYAAVIDGEDVYAFVNGLVKPAEEVLK